MFNKHTVQHAEAVWSAGGKSLELGKMEKDDEMGLDMRIWK